MRLAGGLISAMHLACGLAGWLVLGLPGAMLLFGLCAAVSLGLALVAAPTPRASARAPERSAGCQQIGGILVERQRALDLPCLKIDEHEPRIGAAAIRVTVPAATDDERGVVEQRGGVAASVAEENARAAALEGHTRKPRSLDAVPERVGHVPHDCELHQMASRRPVGDEHAGLVPGDGEALHVPVATARPPDALVRQPLTVRREHEETDAELDVPELVATRPREAPERRALRASPMPALWSWAALPDGAAHHSVALLDFRPTRAVACAKAGRPYLSSGGSDGD
jgi:hypothetical protein